MNTPAKYVAIVIASLSMVMFADLAKVNADEGEASSGLGRVANTTRRTNSPKTLQRSSSARLS